MNTNFKQTLKIDSVKFEPIDPDGGYMKETGIATLVLIALIVIGSWMVCSRECQ